MAAYDLQEQEQLAEIKAWWEKYGSIVTGAVTIVAVVALCWQAWGWYNRNQAAQASSVYSALMLSAQKKDAGAVRQISAKIGTDYAGSIQADLSMLVAARNEIDAKDIKAAKAILERGIKDAKDVQIQNIARLQLAALLLDEKAFDEALNTLKAKPNADLAVRFADLSGDILFAKGSLDEARSAYKRAMDLLSKGAEPDKSPMSLLVKQKLDALGGA